jgi:hypothetical protein
MHAYNGYAQKSFAATYQLRMGFALQPRDPPENNGNKQRVIRLMNGGSELVLLRREEDYAFTYELLVGGTTRDTGAVIPHLAWSHIGIDIKIAGSGGWVKIYVDGTLALSYSGNTGTAQMNSAKFGPESIYSSYDQMHFYLDDIYLDDTTGEDGLAVPPDLHLEYITPNNNGNYSQLDGSDGNQVDNYLQVDERPHDSDTTYNEAQAADEKDSYAMTTVALQGGWSVEAVTPCAVVKKTDGGVASKFALMLRENSVDWEGSAQDLLASYALISERRATDPGGAAWDQDSLDAVEVGVWAEGTF